MLPQNNPDRIRIAFDDHRLVANAGLLLPATLARHLGLRELVDRHPRPRRRAGTGQHGGQAADAGRFRAGGRRLHRRRGCAARRWDGRCSRLHGQGAIYPGHLPAQLSLGARPFPSWPSSPPTAITVNADRDGELLELEAGHRRHAEIENAIRDLKYGVGLNHMPSGHFAANGAWLAVQVMAHNIARWTARIGLGEQVVTTKTLRRRFFGLARRITRSARRLTRHLPQRWPWGAQFDRALARLHALPLPA